MVQTDTYVLSGGLRGLNHFPLSTPLLFSSLSFPFLSFCPFPLKVGSLESKRSEGAP